MRILLAQLNPTVGDVLGNAKKSIEAIKLGKKEGVDLLLFPELFLSGYPPQDLLFLDHFVDSCKHALHEIAKETKEISVIIGFPRKEEGYLKNSAALLQEGRIVDFYDKWLLPTYDVFDERRYFTPGEKKKVWEIAGKKVAVTICEDIWETTLGSYRINPLPEESFDLMVNLSASPFSSTKPEKRIEAGRAVARLLKKPLLLVNQVGANDSLIFDGYSFVVDGEGTLCHLSPGFKESSACVDLDALTKIDWRASPLSDVKSALVLGIADYFHKLGMKKALVGLSGGIDSSLVAALAVEALGKENLLGILMPSRYTSKESIEDAHLLAENLGIETKTIPIEEPFSAYLNTLAPLFQERKEDVTEENLQARIRGALLMALSNKFSALVLSTGNKSEMAMGYATLYGDMCGGLAVINDLTKREVYEVGRLFEDLIPERVFEKAPTAELKPNQKDSDSLPPYEVVDRVLECYITHHLSPEEIAKKHAFPLKVVQELIRRIHLSEYKRRQGAPGLRVSEKAFSVGRRFPIVHQWDYSYLNLH